jgi:hypothetical protein
VTTPPPSLKLRILEAARREPSPTRSVTRHRITVLMAAALVGLAGVFLAIGGLHVDGRPVPHVAGTAMGWAGVAVAVTWQALARGRSMLGRPRSQLLAVVAATPLALLAWLAVWDACYPHAGTSCGLAACIPCFVLTLLLAAAPLGALTIARRESDPVHPRVTGAALGAAAGTWGAVMIDLRCSVVTMSHVALGHALPVVALAGVGALLGRRVVGVVGR